jgi:hypothetical protein
VKRGLREVGTEDLAAALERLLAPRLAEQLRARAPGHCMRVLDLDRELMVRLARRLRADVPGAQVVILRNGAPVTLPELTVTSTKLVELRNPLPDGSLRPPLMVFLPSGRRYVRGGQARRRLRRPCDRPPRRDTALDPRASRRDRASAQGGPVALRRLRGDRTFRVNGAA